MLKAPFPWFGGKSRVAHIVWERFGDVANYVEPFFGSGAVLFGRPHSPKTETVNDLDCYLSNFWRATKYSPDEVAHWSSWPVNEADLHARHLWLINQEEFRERMKTDPDYFDTKIAGWWVWGLCCWIGGGWCTPYGEVRPRNGRDGRDVKRVMPHTGFSMGVHRKIPNLMNYGKGVHRRIIIGNEGVSLVGDRFENLKEYFNTLSNRLNRVRVTCGHWDRILGNASTTKIGTTAVFLDPPYEKSDRENGIYYEDADGIAGDVKKWALSHGDNPRLRIALCGYSSIEHDSLVSAGWYRFNWKSQGGYGNLGNGRGLKNKDRETIWFSPHCLKSRMLPLFDEQYEQTA